MAQAPKRKEAPVEPFKRALSVCVRSVAADDKVEVSYGSGPPAMDGKSIKLPEPPRIPSKTEIAVLRGQADSLALTAACHDIKVHSRLAPGAGPARAVFDAAERARIEALGSLRMPGMASNIAAKIESHYGTRFADVSERSQAPLEDALALLVRERLTGREPPKGAKKLVDLWRPWIEERAGSVLDEMETLAEDQRLFGQRLSEVLRALDLKPDDADGDGEGDEGEPEADPDQESSEGSDEGEDDAQSDSSSQQEMSEGEQGEDTEMSEQGQTDAFDVDAEGMEDADSDEPWRPNTSVLDNPAAFGNKVFSTRHDEELVAEDLRQAQKSLGAITGEVSADEILGRIFASFCIGK